MSSPLEKPSDLVIDSDEDNDAPPEPPRHTTMLFHVTRPSLLSSESSKSTYRGLMNLGMMAVVLINLRQMLELCSRMQWWCSRHCISTVQSLALRPWEWPMLLLFCGLNVFILGTYQTERLAMRGVHIPVLGQTVGPDVIRKSRSTNERAVIRIHSVLLALTLVVPCIAVLLTNPHPAFAAPVVTCYLIWFMKATSYVTVNFQHRCSYIDAHVRYVLEYEERRAASGDSLDDLGSPLGLLDQGQRKVTMQAAMLNSGMFPRYPTNVSLRDIYYFACCPTLCYDLTFPRTRRIRVRWLLRRTFELFLCTTILFLVVDRRLLPHAFDLPFRVASRADLMPVVEIWSRILMFNLLVWLIGFYAFFHLFLNMVAEVLYFGDRLFYLDFWNATTIDHFWRTWSTPGYRWMLRHIYGPLLRSGYSRTQASLVVFLMSALMHEYTLGIMFQQFRFLAFALVALQVPLAIMTQRFVKGTQLGNVIFWINMSFGPHCFCTLVYSLHYLHAHAPTCAASP